VASKNLIGSRATEIVRFANRNEFDMIILVSRRIQDGQPENALGRLSYQVAALASCNVLLLK
jgi:nucleotide-binding universal stress UspA family protein